MKVIIREVVSDDWKAIYLNNEKVFEDHYINIQDICERLQELIDDGNVISSIKGEYYYLDEEYAEEHGFPDRFSNFPKNIFE